MAPTLIPAYQIVPGQIIDLDAEPFPVERVTRSRMTVMVNKQPEGEGGWLPLRWTKLVELLGHFNPENPETPDNA